MSHTIGAVRAALGDGYTIERELGAGGMATVYLAVDLRHRRKVAIKILLPELAATVGHDRFLREMESAANLSHPNVLPMLDSGMVAANVPSHLRADHNHSQIARMIR